MHKTDDGLKRFFISEANLSLEPQKADDDRFKPGTKVYIKNSRGEQHKHLVGQSVTIQSFVKEKGKYLVRKTDDGKRFFISEANLSLEPQKAASSSNLSA